MTSIEIKKALEKGYKITKIYSALSYTKIPGLMKEYVGNFLKMKIENSGRKLLKNARQSMKVIDNWDLILKLSLRTVKRTLA